MLGGNGAGIGTRAGGARPGNGTGLTALQVHNPGTNMSGAEGGRFDDRIREYSAEVVYSGSEPESDSGDDDETMGSAGDRRGVKRERAEMEVAASATSVGLPPGGYGGVTGGATGAKPGKKTRGRVKIKMEFIDNKLRRYTTFSKRKTGIMKKAYELSTLTGTQVLLLVASETGHNIDMHPLLSCLPTPVSLPTTIVTSSVPSTMGGHMMYPGAHTVMYATPTTSLGDGSLTVLNTFPQTAHTQSHDPGAVSQVFLTGHPGTVQIPVSAVQIHPMVIGQQSSSSSNLTELQVVNLDAHHHSKDV
ncbi:hypothetical protein J4Q44_G00283130 [Coregonus suidteri]|uniref:MADS-box domain-containing protein n=1 Tax=Coregonus suidteri TaxID=861788 RepID=A0AAN8QCP6_9TELE